MENVCSLVANTWTNNDMVRKVSQCSIVFRLCKNDGGTEVMWS